MTEEGMKWGSGGWSDEWRTRANEEEMENVAVQETVQEVRKKKWKD